MWLKCTDQHDKPTLINLDQVVRIVKYSPTVTTLFVAVPLGGDKTNALCEIFVKETVEQIQTFLQAQDIRMGSLRASGP